MSPLRNLGRHLSWLPVEVTLTAVAVLGTAGALAVWALVAAATGSSGPEGGAQRQEVTATAIPTSQPTATAIPQPTATPAPPPQPVRAAGASSSSGSTATTTIPARPPPPAAGPAPATGHRLVIPSIGVNAAINLRVVGADGYMHNPNGPTDVVWYDFSAYPGLGGFPGSGGNAVFAGHVDYRNYGPAVFWNIRRLVPGDLMEVYLADGGLVRYVVQWSQWIEPEGDFTPFVAAGPEEYITLVTCIGTFDYATRSYSNRLVVRGIRVP